MTYQRYGIAAEVLSRKTVDFSGGFLLSPFGPYPVLTNETKQTVGQTTIDTYRSKIPQAIIDEFAKAGITATNVSIVNITYEWITTGHHTWYMFPLTPLDAEECQIRILWDARFDTDKDLGHSPLDPITWTIIIKILGIITNAVIILLVSYWIIQAIKDFAESLFTKTSTVTTYDPVTGNIVKEEKTQTPDPTAMIIGGIVVITVVGLGLYMYFGSKKGRRK